MLFRNFKFLLFLPLLLICQVASPQGMITKIRGKVIDIDTKEPVMYANVAFVGTSVGTITSESGEFFIETRSAGDSLTFSCVGYHSKSLKIKKGVYQELNVELKVTSVDIEAVVVKPGERQSTKILRKVIARKKINNPDNYNYSCQSYNKIEIDMNNVDEELKERNFFNKFDFIWNYLDTNAITGKTYLPFFITESISDFYHGVDPKMEKEVVKATKMSGVNNESVAQFTGKFYQNVNIYDNYINIFDQGLISPISNSGMLYYSYVLLDSAKVEGRWCYQISFKPKRKMEPTFEGEMWINDSTFAVVKIQARLSELVNLNYVNDMVATQEFFPIGDTLWFPKNLNLFVDFNISDKTTGFFGHKTTSYSNVVMNDTFPDQVTAMLTNVEVQENALKQNDDYWNNSRPFELTKREANIYQMVDSVQQVPFYKTFVDVVNMLVNYYYVVGYVEIGPYYQTYSFNEIEGNRFKISGRTSNKFSTNLMISGFLAYGDKDDRFKYGLEALYMLNKNPRSSISVSYKNDIEQLGQSPYALTEDNILTSFLRRNPNNKITLVRNFSTTYQKEWFIGFSNTIKISNKTFFPTQYIPFQTVDGGQAVDRISSTSITLNTRWQKDERYVEGEFERLSMGSKWPEINFDVMKSFDFAGGHYDYWELKFNYYHKFNINPIGYMRVIVDAGKIFGTVPYPLLRLHEGNETYAFERYGFNMMNYYEFASDQYASLTVEHHFQGLFLNKIPLLRRLKFREVATAKMLVGSISDANKMCMVFPEGLNELTKPYAEVGVGVENILNVIRIDAIWRLSYLDNPNIQTFGIRAGLQFIF